LIIATIESGSRRLQEAACGFSESRGIYWTKAAKAAKSSRLALRARFDRIFRRRTGFVTLDRLLKRLNACQLGRAADGVCSGRKSRYVPTGSENDIPCQGTRRKLSAGSRSGAGRDCSDTLRGLAKTCAKHGVARFRRRSRWNTR
jgi:hypothetical protein